jgi:HSP20 family protein
MSMLDPFGDLTRLRGQIDRLFDERQGARTQENERIWRPAVDVFEDEDFVTLKLDLPGIDREKLDVQLTGEELTIHGERPWVKPDRGGCVHSERPHGQFHRTFRIGVPVQVDQVDAGYKDGVLTVRLPKSPAVKPRKVAVTSEPE